MIHLWHFFLHWTGSDNTSGVQYGFWSGFGSDMGEATILAVLYKKLNCHQPGCWRIGLHHHENGKFIYCGKHHPEINNG